MKSTKAGLALAAAAAALFIAGCTPTKVVAVKSAETATVTVVKHSCRTHCKAFHHCKHGMKHSCHAVVVKHHCKGHTKHKCKAHHGKHKSKHKAHAEKAAAPAEAAPAAAPAPAADHAADAPKADEAK